jgi:tyrosine aminotransferase
MLPPKSSDNLTSKKNSWNVEASVMAKTTFNPIRNILETMDLKPNPEKPMISLSIGDPTVFGNLEPPKVVLDAIAESVLSGKRNGYAPSTGYLESRQAVANHINKNPNLVITADDVILCSGCSCSLDLCITVLANPGDNILVPRPGFPLYSTLAKGLGINTKEYNLLPEENWMVDLDHMEAMIDEHTKAIVINNPSNPCGSVFDEAHLRDILDIAERHCIPIIADEIYEHFVFEGANKTYVPMASLTSTVPILSCGGLTKRYLIPGWRMGWITIHDAQGIFTAGDVRHGLQCLSQRIIGSNTLVQGALPKILEETPQSFYKDTLKVIEFNAKLAYDRLKRVPGLKPVMPEGAMYMMVGIDLKSFPDFQNDLQIVEALVRDQSVFCLPGKCFNIPNFFRIVLTVPKEMLVEACSRIEEFCSTNSSTHTSPLAASAFLSKSSSIDEEESVQCDSACSSMVHSSEDEDEEEEPEVEKLYTKYAPVSFIIRPRKSSVTTKLA